MKTERTIWEIETSENVVVADKSLDPKVDVVDSAFAEPEVNVAGDPITLFWVSTAILGDLLRRKNVKHNNDQINIQIEY